MLRTRLIRWIVVLACVVGICGCAKETPQEEPTKTAAEYKAEAEKQIDEKNADAELQKLEQSIEQDATTTP